MRINLPAAVTPAERKHKMNRRAETKRKTEQRARKSLPVETLAQKKGKTDRRKSRRKGNCSRQQNRGIFSGLCKYFDEEEKRCFTL
jgi:hypothetical protein